ncbi:Atypical kinase COQ8, mitochondrial [Golovinomyces cichoracearum]|uniref:Atypical kinase COQ8, mitochondrial n=1 Tax=Golovinomyces cichoracearum TaxID=62708 RepID=A0A420HHF5_9PEZI|nr:Atypical kinase COQ8, mitochondrial [Golovinomyces cichoracearum]
MASKRILDIVAILNASCLVIQRHVEMRSNQLGLYTKTSSPIRAIRSQTIRITNTFAAASFLASRLRETTTSDTFEKTTEYSLDQTDSELSLDPKSSRNSSESSIYIKQINSDEPLIYGHSSIKKTPNESLEELVNGNEEQNSAKLSLKGQVSNGTLPGIIDRSFQKKKSIHSRSEDQPGGKEMKDAINHIHEQDYVPGDVNINLFQSPRVARSLGGNLQGGQKIGLTSGDVKNVANSVAKLAENSGHSETYRSTHSDLRSEILNKPNIKPAQVEPKINVYNTRNKENFGAKSLSRSSSSELRESRVPASRISRLWNYGGLAAGMLGGVVRERFRRASDSGGTKESDGASYILSASNVDRLVTKLSRMRGAALKLGQMISFQDSNMLPTPVQEVLQRLQDRADYMPSDQRDKVLKYNLGSEWRNLFSSFEEIPIAAASIGQVHRAILKSNGAQVAVKVQYPGVAESINSDLKNLEILLTASRLLPKGLFLDKTISNARTELAWECDYLREAECVQRFQQLLHDESSVFAVPHVFAEASGKQVLTMEFMNGVAITKIKNLTQEQKDWIGTQILRLCLREIVEFRFMQTDPNWTNFLFNKNTNKLELLDFGASREYNQDFVSKYIQLLAAASRSDRESLMKLSTDLGYLTGFEPKTMIDAHISSVLTLAEPFLETSQHLYDFRDQTITDRVRSFIPVMIRERLAPPPEETYSLHRKLSGAFLLCARLGSRVPCRKLFEESLGKSRLI